MSYSLGTIAVNGSVTLTVTAQTLEDGTVANSASATATSADPNSSNSSASASTSVAEAPLVVSAPITKTTRGLSNVAVATFTHAGGVEPVSAFTAKINWGDGSTSTGTITLSGTTYTVAGSHKYRKTGTYTISTSVTEIGNAAQMLLAKMGDEVPGLPDRLGAGRDAGQFPFEVLSNSDDVVRPIDQIVEELAAAIAHEMRAKSSLASASNTSIPGIAGVRSNSLWD